MKFDLEKLHISKNLRLPTELDLEEYMRSLHNDGTGPAYVMSQLAIPKLILLSKYYYDLWEDLYYKNSFRDNPDKGY